jgi:hypothetical protein
MLSAARVVRQRECSGVGRASAHKFDVAQNTNSNASTPLHRLAVSTECQVRQKSASNLGNTSRPASHGALHALPTAHRKNEAVRALSCCKATWAAGAVCAACTSLVFTWAAMKLARLERTRAPSRAPHRGTCSRNSQQATGAPFAL